MADRYEPSHKPQPPQGGPSRPPARPSRPAPGPRPAGPRPSAGPSMAGPSQARPRPGQAASGHRQMPVPNAQAAQRAARSSLNAQAAEEAYDPYGDYGSQGHYYGQDYPSYTDSEGQNQDYTSSYAYLDDLIDDVDEARPSLPLPVKIGLIAGGAVVGLLLLFVLIRAVFLSDNSDVRLQRQTLPKKGIMETTKETTRPTSSDLPTLPDAEHTLPPLGTDPYDHAPAWTPPTSPPTEAPTAPSIAPPPLVIDIPETQPELPPAYIEPQAPEPEWTEPVVTEPVWTEPSWLETEPTFPVEVPSDPLFPEEIPSQPEAPAPSNSFPFYIDENGEIVIEGIGEIVPEGIPQPPTPPQSSTALEEQQINLPDISLPGDSYPPYMELGSNIPGLNSSFIVRPDVNGQFGMIALEGDFESIYHSPDGSHSVGYTQEGEYKLFSNLQAGAIDLPFAAAQGLDRLVGNQGLAYISSGQLFYLSYQDLSPRVVLGQVSDALMAEKVGQFLVVSDASVQLVTPDGVEQLTLPYSSQGNIRLNTFTEDGRLAIFQDDMTVYIYQPEAFGNNLVRIPKLNPGSPSYIQRSQDGREALTYQVGGNAISRLNPNGVLDQISNPNWNLSEQSWILPVGNDQGSVYGSLAVWDQGNLYMANASSPDDIQGGSEAGLLATGVKEAFGAGYGLYWTDSQGSFYALDTRADLASGEAAAIKIAEGGVNQISSNEDGSAIYYLKDGSLWERRSGSVATKLADNVASYMTNPEGSKFYLVTTEGGLQVLSGGQLSELSAPGSGVNASSFDVNPLVSKSGNIWLATPRIVWMAGGMVYQE